MNYLILLLLSLLFGGYGHESEIVPLQKKKKFASLRQFLLQIEHIHQHLWDSVQYHTFLKHYEHVYGSVAKSSVHMYGLIQ